MKNLTLTVVALLTVLSATLASGNEAITSQAKAVNIQNRVIKVLYTSSECTPVKVKIKDDHGRLLHQDRIKEDGGFMKPYNIKNLSAGTYTIEITDATGTRTESVSIN